MIIYGENQLIHGDNGLLQYLKQKSSEINLAKFSFYN